MKRLPGESYEDYRERRKLMQRHVKLKIQGKWHYKTTSHVDPLTKKQIPLRKNGR